MIPLRERARLANSSDGDIFVSIHVNSIRSHTTSHGVETYYLGPTKDPLLTQLAAEENGSSGYSIADLRKLLDRVYADVRRDESRRLASTLQGQLLCRSPVGRSGTRKLGSQTRAVHRPGRDRDAGGARRSRMSFRMREGRAAAMRQRGDYRQQIAQALFRGIHA